MALFRRRRSSSQDSAVAVAEFWAAWPDLRPRLATSIDAGEAVPDEVAQRLTAAVQRIHPSLTWEIEQAPPAEEDGGLAELGLDDLSDDALSDLARLDSLSDTTAAEAAEDTEGAGGRPTPQYVLTVTGGSDDSARVLAERWAQAAPAETGWRFFPARQADHARLGRSITWDGHELDLGHTTVALRVNQTAAKIEASVYHPDFMFLPEETRSAVAEHVVLLALGEDDMVRWIGSVTPLVEKPLDPLPPTSMPSVAKQLAGTLSRGGWVTMQGRIPLRGALEIVVRYPLHRRDFPAFTLYVPVTLGYANSDGDRLPEEDSATALAEFAANAQEILGEHGALFAQQTSGGQRQLHFYIDPDWEAIEQLSKPIRRQLGS